jgi:hypothetical protein
MLSQRFFFVLPLAACALALVLSGCAAAPLAQMAVTQMAARPACQTAYACQPSAAAGSMGDVSKGFGDSFHKLTSLVSDSQEVPAAASPAAK